MNLDDKKSKDNQKNSNAFPMFAVLTEILEEVISLLFSLAAWSLKFLFGWCFRSLYQKITRIGGKK